MNKTFKALSYAAMGAYCFPQLLHAQKQTQPNVLFIMVDDMGWNDLSCNGSDYYETPNIDKLASEGMFFNSAYASAANSAPSRSCFMTGLYTPRHGVFTVSPSARGKSKDRKLIPIKNTEDVAPHFVSLAEALESLGYESSFFGKWHMGDDLDGSMTGPLSQGFDYNIGGNRCGHPYTYFAPYCRQNHCHQGLEVAPKGEYLNDRLTNEAIKWLDKRDKDKPFFMYMAHYAVHTPLMAPKDLIEKYKAKKPGKYQKNAVYAAMMENMDMNVGKLLDAFDNRGLKKNTVVIFFSDNGGVAGITNNYQLRGGKGMPYEGGIREPMIIRYPGKVKAGTKSDALINGVDFYPTIVNIAGGKPAKNLDGQDIFKTIKSKKDRDLFWHFPAYLSGSKKIGMKWRATPYSIVRSGDYKLIYFYENKNIELYNIKKDIKETQELSTTMPKKAKQLKEKLFKWLKDTKAPLPTTLNPEYVSQ